MALLIDTLSFATPISFTISVLQAPVPTTTSSSALTHIRSTSPSPSTTSDPVPLLMAILIPYTAGSYSVSGGLFESFCKFLIKCHDYLSRTSDSRPWTERIGIWGRVAIVLLAPVWVMFYFPPVVIQWIGQMMWKFMRWVWTWLVKGWKALSEWIAKTWESITGYMVGSLEEVRTREREENGMGVENVEMTDVEDAR